MKFDKYILSILLTRDVANSGKSLRQLESISGVDHIYIHRLMNASNNNISIQKLFDIANALGCDARSWIKESSYKL